MDDNLKKYLSDIGRRGGQSATGDKKRRSPEHYKRMVDARRQRKLKEKPNDL